MDTFQERRWLDQINKITNLSTLCRVAQDACTVAEDKNQRAMELYEQARADLEEMVSEL